MDLTRRQLFGLSGSAGAAAVLALAGCTPRGTAPSARDQVVWWDVFQPLSTLEQKTFDRYAGAGTVPKVTYTVYDPAGLGSALQLAQQSSRLPDVFTNGFGVPDLVLVDNGWVQPITLDASTRAALGDSLLDGVHVFDGDVYTLPIFTAHQHSTLTWFDRDAVEAAGGDPETGPRSWDEFRTLARRITRRGRMHGWIEGSTLIDRMRQHVIDLATGAGAVLSFAANSADAPGVADARTGDYPFDGEEFTAVFDFLGALVKDGVMFPSSTSLDVRTARARWAGGAAGLFFDGTWNVGVLKGQFPDFLSGVGVGDMPTPDSRPHAMNGAAGGSFWISADAPDPKGLSSLIASMTTAGYARSMAEAMDQPPADVDAVAAANVPDLYRDAVSLMARHTRLAPSPVVRNPDVGAVLAEMNQIRPTLGEIVQGHLGGNVDDVHAELRSLTSRLSAERDRAIRVVRGRGVRVSLDDWRFENATADDDYTAERYPS